jgi:broad specificity phosphatase PhoE
MSTIVLIRHCETDLRGKFCGHSDPDLNAVGRQRLDYLGKEVDALGVSRIFSSDLQRALRTATAISERIGVPVEIRPRLREINFGLWEGLSWEEIEQQYHTEAGLWVSEFPARSAPGGEAYQDFVARVEAEFKAILSENNAATCAVVTHRGVMQYALTQWFGFSEDEARKRTDNYGAIFVATQSTVPARNVSLHSA